MSARSLQDTDGQVSGLSVAEDFGLENDDGAVAYGEKVRILVRELDDELLQHRPQDLSGRSKAARRLLGFISYSA